MTRTSTRMVRLSPTRSNSRSWSTRSSFTWSFGDMLLISSRKMVPPWAASNRPVLLSTAPVNAPLTWPNSSLSSRFSCSAPQLTRTYGPSDRRLSLWTALAMTSLPVPVSPMSRTLAERARPAGPGGRPPAWPGRCPRSRAAAARSAPFEAYVPASWERKPGDGPLREGKQGNDSDWCAKLPHEPPGKSASQPGTGLRPLLLEQVGGVAPEVAAEPGDGPELARVGPAVGAEHVVADVDHHHLADHEVRRDRPGRRTG